MAEINRFIRFTYSDAEVVPICQAPQTSLPTPQYLTLYGSWMSIGAAFRPHSVSAGELQ